MRPENIRTLYESETPATDAESTATREELRTDPDAARKLIETCFALKYNDAIFAKLYRLSTDAILEDLIRERATDDAFALAAAALIQSKMDEMAAQSARVPRGKAKRARSA